MRRSYQPLMSIPLEGWVVLALLAGVALVFYVAGAHQLAFVVLLAQVPAAWFFSDPHREVPARPRGVLSPVDGTVVHRRECHDAVMDREAIRITIDVACWGSYALRAPTEGEVISPPQREDERLALIRTDEKQDVLLRVSRGSLFGMRPLWIPFGERVGQGRRCGLRRFARQIEVYVPASARVDVDLGSRVRCGQTVLATLIRKA